MRNEKLNVGPKNKVGPKKNVGPEKVHVQLKGLALAQTQFQRPIKGRLPTQNWVKLGKPSKPLQTPTPHNGDF